MRPLHGGDQRNADVHGLPARAGARERAAAAAAARQAVLRRSRPAARRRRRQRSVHAKLYFKFLN